MYKCVQAQKRTIFKVEENGVCRSLQAKMEKQFHMSGKGPILAVPWHGIHAYMRTRIQSDTIMDWGKTLHEKMRE